jgi:EmrB/QacA subfamily drug resistance transporter
VVGVPELSRRRRLLILGICCLSLLIVGMDNTIVNVGLTTIKNSLHTNLSDLQWTIDAYTLVLASLLMFSGSTADRLGRRRVFQIGLTLFTIGSLLCSLAPSLGWLIAFRALQAVGGSMLNPVAMSIITNVFTDPKERARAIGVWGGVVGVSLGLGPVVGGALIDSVGWRSIFWINVPVGVAAFVLAALFVPESRAPRPRRPDPGGQAFVVLGLGGLTYAIIESSRVGWTSAETIIALAVAVVGVVGLLIYEPRRAEPLIDLRFFRSAPFSGATVIAVCAFGAFAGFLFITTLYLQQVRGLSPLEAGCCLIPFAVTTLVVAPLSGRLVASSGPRLPLVLAGVLLTVGGLLLSFTGAGTPLAVLIVLFVVFAAGFGLVNAPITNTAVSGMPRDQAGVAAAVASTSRQVGNTLGVAVVGTVLAAGLGTAVTATGFDHADGPAWLVITGASFVVLVLGWLTTGRRAVASAERTAELMTPADPVAA